ncbi:MAG: AAA family ATPase [Tepidisphaeraceae bacterium]
MSNGLPGWASEMRDLFRAGSTAQFILHGNVFDVVPANGKQHSLKSFLDEVMFESFDVVLHYDRGKGIRATKGAEDYGKWLQDFAGEEMRTFAQERRPGPALELMDRYLLRTLNLRAIGKGKVPGIAIVIDFAEFVVPRGDPLQLGSEFSANLVKMLSWANDPTILDANIAVILITEGLHNVDELIVENPHAAKLKIPLPGEPEMLEYLNMLASGPIKDLAARSDISIDNLARRMTGVSRIGARTAISLALNNGGKLTSSWLSKMKKELIERETQGLLDFIESPFTLDHVAGLDEVKAWLREDAELLKRSALHALPMGYLIAGRIGTGKTFIVNCWAGELGIPCVAFKNFRDKWVGATESNLEKIFAILRALGQVVVFVDEADQMTGKREGGGDDSGLSGRVYAMLAAEMSNTRNRGKIMWVFATSRPDLLEVDLKRQGRLDVHIPLFPPQTSKEMHALLLAIAKKLKFPLAETDLPELPPGVQLGGNEIEGILVRALRIFELSTEPKRPLKDILAETFKEVRPSAHTRKLEYMDLVAVRECTDARFLPPHYKDMPPEEVEARIQELRPFV